MNWKNVRFIFEREFRDQVRDRRTLFMVVVLPLLLYPGLAIGMVEISFLFREQPRTVVMLGAASLPDKPPLLNGDRFASNWFALPDDVDKLHVISDLAAAAQAKKGAPDENAELLAQARDLRPLVERRNELDRAEEAARKADDQDRLERLAPEIRSVRDELAEQFNSTKIQVLIVVPDGLKEQIEKTNRHLVSGQGGAPTDAAVAVQRPLVVENSADEKSLFAYQRVKEVLYAWEQQLLQDRLSAAHLPSTLSTPVNARLMDVAVASQLSANLWSKMFPTLLIIMAVTGAFYPAVDVAAGEKERGTMETLLICPARRSEIVLGKFFTVLAFSVSTVLLNLASMGLTGKYVVAMARSEALSKMGAVALTFPGPREVLWLLVLMLPLAAFYSAISLALATFARSTKEGQYYLTPLLLVTLGLTLFCLSPAVEIEPFYSILPVVGPALLLKQVLASPGHAGALVYALPVLVSSVGYSLAGLWWAITMFQREDVLFREAERFDLRLWLRHLLRDKDPTPSSAEAVLCFVLIMMLQFVAIKFLRGGLFTADGRLYAPGMMRLLLIQQMVFVGCPALFMGIMLTTSVVRTFRLRLPARELLVIGCLLPLALHPLTIQLETWLQAWNFFPPLPKYVVELMRAISNPAVPFWLVILSMAVAPAICEETAFRGFILSGFARSSRPRAAIVLSSIAFGIMHLIPQQVFSATLLGLLLGLLAMRSGSLLPGIAFHLVFNSLELLRTRAASIHFSGPVVGWFATLSTTKQNESIIEYNWPTLIVAGVIAAWMIHRLVRYAPERGEPEQIDEDVSRKEASAELRSAAAPPVAAP